MNNVQHNKYYKAIVIVSLVGSAVYAVYTERYWEAIAWATAIMFYVDTRDFHE
jgi:uncharacterized protein (DUF697 family)